MEVFAIRVGEQQCISEENGTGGVWKIIDCLAWEKVVDFASRDK